MRKTRGIPTVDATNVVVFRERDADIYYSGANGFLPIARAVFNERCSEPTWWRYPTEPPTPPPAPPVVPEGVVLPPQLLVALRAEESAYPHKLATYEKDCQDYDTLLRARTGDDVAAAEFLLSRQDHEYERFYVAKMLTPR